MTSDEVTVDVRQPDGSLQEETRTLWNTEYGPVFTSILGLPLFPWTPTTAYAMGDVNAENLRYLNHFFETDHAQSTKELYEILKRYQGIPWVNTIASDERGRALYADVGAIPAVAELEDGVVQHGARRRHQQPARAARARRLALGLQLGRGPGRGRARHLRPVERAPPLPRRLRHQLQRQLLALQPRAAARGLRPDHRRRAHRRAACAPGSA